MISSSKNTVFVDSDVFVALFFSGDANAERARRLLQKLTDSETNVITSNMVRMETATVLSHRQGMTAANQFLASTKLMDAINATDELLEESLQLFSEQQKRGSSVVDCINVSIMRRYGITEIASFDKAYPKQYGVALVSM